MVYATVCYNITYTGRYDRHKAIRLYWTQYGSVLLTLVVTMVIRRFGCIGAVCYSTTYTGRYDRHKAIRLYWTQYGSVLLTLVATIVIRRCDGIGDCMLEYYLHWSLRSS